MSDTDLLLVSLASVLILGIGAQWLAWRVRLPSILLLLTFGFLAGPVTGLVKPAELLGETLFPFVSLAVALILFEGGLSLRISEFRESAKALRGLLTAGVLITGALATLGAVLILDMPLATALLLGAILVVTGPTVVGPLLRHIRPTGRVGPIANWEGIVGDPIGAVLAVLIFQVQPLLQATAFGEALGGTLLGLLKTAAIGIGIGYGAAAILVLLLSRYWIPDYLQSPVVLMMVIAAFTGSNLLQHESGLLTVTVMGMALANQKQVAVKHILEFKENLRVLLISSLFILLAARVDLEAFLTLGWQGAAFVVFLILVVRPAAVFLSTSFSALTRREKAFLSWMAPRGIVAAAVASVFALQLGDAGKQLVPATFMVIVGTVTVYGLTGAAVARKLGLASAEPQGVVIAGAHAGVRAMAHALKEAGYRVVLIDTTRPSVHQAQMEGLEAVYASILSESAMDDLELGGIGRFLGLTSNDQVNSLAALHFSELFGRGEVYQLTPESDSARKETAAHHLHGRLLFQSDLTYGDLDARFAAGNVVRKTKLTEEYDYEKFQATYGEEALPLFIVQENGRLTICTAGQNINPRPGQTLIGLLPPRDKVKERQQEGDLVQKEVS